MSTIRQFDAYAKTLDDFRVQTKSGALVTLISAIVIVALLVTEWIDFTAPTTISKLIVDSGRKDSMDIYLNITFPNLPCAIMSLDVMDVSGAHQNEITHHIFKTRLDLFGKPISVPPEKEMVGTTVKKLDGSNGTAYCGSCYGGVPPPSGCCNSCKDVELAYSKKGWSFAGADKMEQCIRDGYLDKLKSQAQEGCNINGHLTTKKVAGNFHFAPGRSFDQSKYHIHDISAISRREFDFSHTIHYLSFGKVVPGMQNPMDGAKVSLDAKQLYMIQNFIKVVGTHYRFLNGSTIFTNQFSVTEYTQELGPISSIGMTSVPGLFFHFDISPMLVIHEESTKSLSYFLTSLCAVVGGVFTVAGLIDAALYRTARALQHKIDLGKTN